MLDVDHLKWSGGGDGGAAAAAAAASLLADVEDTMEDAAMLFDLDDDWLHEHNLDVLFDLFEEELEGSGKADATGSLVDQQLGSSPITSYLFGSSASSLASALDLYDLLYFDATQQQQPSTSTPPAAVPTAAFAGPQPAGSNAKQPPAPDARPRQHQPSGGQASSGSRQAGPSAASNSLNVMRIKRRLKRGQSEGVSLLASPDNTTSRNHNNKTSDKYFSNTTSTITNSAASSPIKLSTTTSPTNGIDIGLSNRRQHQPRNRHLYHYHQHHVTACSVIREHAYAAVRHPTIQIN